MNPHPSRICDNWLDHKGRCSECMSPIEEIDFWRECYNGKHNDPADCPTWYDWCNCGGTMFEENERLYEENKKMKELLKTIYETDCLRDWAFEEDDDGSCIAYSVRKIVKESK